MKTVFSIKLLASAVACLATSVASASTLAGHGAFSPSSTAQSCFTEYRGGIRNQCGRTEPEIYFNLQADSPGTYSASVVYSGVGTATNVTCRLQKVDLRGAINDTTATTLSANVYGMGLTYTTYVDTGWTQGPEVLRMVCDNIPNGMIVFGVEWHRV